MEGPSQQRRWVRAGTLDHGAEGWGSSEAASACWTPQAPPEVRGAVCPNSGFLLGGLQSSEHF